MKSVLRTSAFIFAAVMLSSSVSESMAYQKNFEFVKINAAEEIQFESSSLSDNTNIAQHIDFYNTNKDNFDIKSEKLQKLIDMAKSDNEDNTYETLNYVAKKTGQDVSTIPWSDSLAAQVTITEIMMSGGFIDASAQAYQNQYNLIVDGLLAEVRKNNSNADKNSIYKMNADSFNTYMRSAGLTKNNLDQIKAAYPGTNDYYNYSVAFAAYLKSRKIIMNTLSLCSKHITGDGTSIYAEIMKEMGEGYAASSFASFQKAGLKPLISTDISLESSEKIVTSYISQLLSEGCKSLSLYMSVLKLSYHKNLDFFDEILTRYSCPIKSRAEERDLLKSAYIVYKAAATSMSSSDNGSFISDIKTDGSSTSLDKFENGMALYKQSALLALKHAEQYAVIKSVKDKEFETQSLETNALITENNVKNMVCHGEGSGLKAAAGYNAFTVSGPVNVTVYNGSEKAAEITGGKIVISDNTNLMRLNIIQLTETEKNPAKTLVIPSEFKIKITASGDGKMTLSNVMSEEGKPDISSLFSNIPVKNQNEFELDMNKYILKNVSENITYPDEITKDIPVADILRGDVDNDGVINAKDLVYMQKCILSPDTFSMPGSDLNGDGKTDSTDMIELKKIFL